MTQANESRQPVKVGLMMSNLPSGLSPLDMAQVVEDLGFDSCWTGEHFTNWSPVSSAVVSMAMMAARTQRITLGSAIILLPLRHPVPLAKDLGTLDILSGGRLIVGVGVGGENPREFEACGIPVRERGPRASEAIQVMKKLWGEKSVDFPGRFFPLRGATMEPKPVQSGGPPVWVGGRRESAMRRAARYADGWLPYLYSPEQYRESVTKIATYACEAGRDPEAISKGLFIFTCVADSRAEARATVEARLGRVYRQDFSTIVERCCLAGTPEECVARLREYVDAGARHIILTPCCPAEDVPAQVQAFATRLAPGVRRLGGKDG
ncbi:MAG: LLM class flavin-dependent oxidoreductase [Dehalococcoidia bacterium]|nr:LLM class flavin-dependent oxidoreductase [Dehalococcoidia bacterium]